VDEGFGTYHSRALVMGGSAVLDGARNLVDAIRASAAAYFGCPVEQVDFADGRVHGPAARSITLAKLGELAAGAGKPVTASGTFANTRRTYSYGAHAAHVAVDPATGHVAVLDYLSVEDVGRAVNPGIVHGQAIGAAVQGLGGVFLDHLLYDANAQLLNASLADYLMPLPTDFPRVRGLTLELRPSPSNPLGAKGAGEGGIVAVAATVANAVAAALVRFGVEPNDLPLTPPRLWHLIQTAKAEKARTKTPVT